MNVNEALAWYDSFNEDIGYKVEHNKNAFAILLNTLMMQQGISKAELAHRIRKSAPYVTKLLRGDENLTISTMTKLLYSLDCELHINGCHKEQEGVWRTVIDNNDNMNKANKECSALWAKSNYGKEAA